MSTTQIDPRMDHYKVLGVKSDASAAEIKKAYRDLAKKYHPDSTGGDKVKEARFKEVSQAYDVVGDADKRAQYDALRAGAGRYGGFPGGFSANFEGGGVGGLGDLFSQIFQGAGRRGRPNGNVRYEFSQGGMPFGADVRSYEAHRGGSRARAKPRPPRERKVRASDGSTVVRRGNDIHSDLRLSLDQAILGTVVEVATLDGKAKVKIPPGTSSGVKLRLKGKGAQVSGSPGDHYVTVHIDVPKKIDEKAKKLLVQFMRRVKS